MICSQKMQNALELICNKINKYICVRNRSHSLHLPKRSKQMGKYVIKKSTKDTDQPYYFVLKADNGQVIATSEMYASKQGAENGIASVKNNADSIIVDES